MKERETQEELRTELLEVVGSLKGYLLKAVDTGGKVRMFSTARTTKADAPGEVESSGEVKSRVEQLAALEEELRSCRRCPLWTTRRTVVFGEGNPDARLMFVGEGPGEEEDRQERPFVGRAGQLLTRIINAMGLSRDDVYIANIVKCRPPGNRVPDQEEKDACTPYLCRQVEIIKPRVICALGSVAARFFLKTEAAVSVLRGRFHSLGSIDLMATYHPAYLLRNPNAKKQVWEDVQEIMKRLKQ